MLPDSGTAAPHILVVDDDATIRRLYQTALRYAGYRVTALDDPALEPAAVAALAPDAAVLDLRFDGADLGPTLLRRLRADPATADIPVLVCSAAVEQADAIRAHLSARDCGFLAKPFALDDLLQAIESGVGSGGSACTIG